jgi:Tfp pilus assembly protein PilV
VKDKREKQTTKERVQGFTLVETLVAVTLLAFVVIGVTTMTTMHIKSNFYTQHHTKAVQLAESAIETLMRTNFNQLTPGTTTEDYGQISMYPNYKRTVTVTYIDADNVQLTAAVNWSSRESGASRAGLELPPITLSVRRTR